MNDALKGVRTHQHRLRKCTRCPAMTGPPVIGEPVVSPVLLLGQAPGSREIVEDRPFAWTAGRTLFEWFESIGLPESGFRRRVYMAAVCRCYPGKRPSGGDRVPARDEIANCAPWLEAELDLLRPRLILAAGRLAIGRLLPPARLDQLVGRLHPVTRGDLTLDVAPLPHPSGASPWHRTEPGRTLLTRALARIARHPAWREIAP